MLFDATRRNPTILYVTQKQNGLMIEGHREIIGAAPEKKSRSEPYSKSGLISTRANENKERDNNNNQEDDSNYNEIMEFAANQQAALLKKHPLRIDIRDNNPEQIVAEKLLESTEFMIPSNGKQIKNVSHHTVEEDEEVNSMIISDQREQSNERPTSANYLKTSRLINRSSSNQVTNFSTKQRPHSASNFTGINRPPKSQNPVVIRPTSSSAGLTRTVGISGEGIRHNIRPEKKNFFNRGNDDDSDIINDDGEDGDEILLADGDDETNQYIKLKLIEKKNERLEGTKGAGVGSLLDTEIRKMQMQSNEPQTLHNNINNRNNNNNNNNQLIRSAPKKIRRKILSKPSNRILTSEEKKKEMKGVYVTPIIQPVVASRQNKNNNFAQPVVRSIARSASADQKANPKGYVEKKRVLITSQYDLQQQQQQKLGFAKSAPNIRPVSGGSTSMRMQNNNNNNNNNNNQLVKTTGNINPYTQRSLNPGILF